MNDNSVCSLSKLKRGRTALSAQPTVLMLVFQLFLNFQGFLVLVPGYINKKFQGTRSLNL